MPAHIGHPKKGGRQKGSKNKTTLAAKEAFAMAFDELGGYKAMVQWAKADPDNKKVFYTLYARLIPVDVTTAGKELPPATITFEHVIVGG